MKLSCDCYPGCWGTHSENWPEIPAHLFSKIKSNLNYGEYVFMEDKVRIEPTAYCRFLEQGNVLEL